MSSGRSDQAPFPIAARQPATLRSAFARSPALKPPRPILVVRLDEGVGDGMDEVGVRRHVVLPCRRAPPCRPDGSPPNPTEAPSTRSSRLWTAVRQVAYVPRCGTRDEDAPVPRVVERERRELRKRHHEANTRCPKGMVVRWVAGERRSSMKRTGRLRYDPRRGGDPSGVSREPAVPFTWRGFEYRSRRVCVGVGSGLVPQCLSALQSGDLHEVTRSLEPQVRPITSTLCTWDSAGFALRGLAARNPSARRATRSLQHLPSIR